jgi:hypothetical protein
MSRTARAFGGRPGIHLSALCANATLIRCCDQRALRYLKRLRGGLSGVPGFGPFGSRSTFCAPQHLAAGRSGCAPLWSTSNRLGFGGPTLWKSRQRLKAYCGTPGTWNGGRHRYRLHGSDPSRSPALVRHRYGRARLQAAGSDRANHRQQRPWRTEVKRLAKWIAILCKSRSCARGRIAAAAQAAGRQQQGDPAVSTKPNTVSGSSYAKPPNQ